jgi:hypothetical protein
MIMTTSFKSQDLIFIKRMLGQYVATKHGYSLFWNACKRVWKGSSIHRMQSLIMEQNLWHKNPSIIQHYVSNLRSHVRLRLKCDSTRAETRFRLSAKRTSPFKSAGASVQSTTGSRGVHISGINAGYTTFRGSVKSTGYQLHSPVSP